MKNIIFFIVYSAKEVPEFLRFPRRIEGNKHFARSFNEGTLFTYNSPHQRAKFAFPRGKNASCQRDEAGGGYGLLTGKRIKDDFVIRIIYATHVI